MTITYEIPAAIEPEFLFEANGATFEAVRFGGSDDLWYIRLAGSESEYAVVDAEWRKFTSPRNVREFSPVGW